MCHVIYDAIPYDVTPYDAIPYDVTPYDAIPYDVTPYDVTPYDVTPYDVTPYDVTPYDVIHLSTNHKPERPVNQKFYCDSTPRQMLNADWLIHVT